MFEIQQFIADHDDWFTVDSFDTLKDAEDQLAVLRADAYYSKFEFRIFSATIPN